MKALARKIRRPLTIGIALLVFAAIPGLALAQTDDTAPPSDRAVTDRPLDDRPERDRDRDLEGTKARILEAIDKRLAALDRLSEVAKENEHLTKEHEKDLQDDYKDAEKILDDAAKDVEKAETLAELREVVPAAFENTLVFALQTPKTHLVIASDRMVKAYERLEQFAENLQIVINRLAENGHDMTVAQTALDEMVLLNEAAESLGAPVADAVIWLDPEDWPDPAKAVLEQGRADLKAAGALLREAGAKAHETIKAIRQALSS